MLWLVSSPMDKAAVVHCPQTVLVVASESVNLRTRAVGSHI